VIIIGQFLNTPINRCRVTQPLYKINVDYCSDVRLIAWQFRYQ